MLPVRLALLLTLLLTLLPAAPARAQQHEIAAGETLEISVFRVPELTREVVVDIDGQIAFPPLGQIPAAGMTAAEIAEEIQTRLAGLEIMLDAQVTVGLRAVRPVVIGGDIANPGAIPYERGMTVRRAMALAGGLGALRPSMGMATELRAERDSVSAELLGRRATLARARAELANGGEISARDVPGLQGSDQAAVLTLANSLLNAARVESDAQKAFLVRDLDIIADRIDRLGEQKEHQRELVEQQTAEVERYTDMQRRGLTPQTRVSEEYRTLNELRSDLAEIEAYITDVGRERESAMHELARHDDRRAAALEAEAQTALTEIGALEARLRGVTAQLTQLGLAGHDPVRVTLYRVTGGQETPVSATEATLLQPGDLVEVELPDSFYGTPQPASIASSAGSPAPAVPRTAPPRRPVRRKRAAKSRSMNQINNIPERPVRLTEARPEARAEARAAARPAAARPAASFTLADVFDAIRRSPLLVILLTAIGGGGAYIVAKVMPDAYEATAMIISDADRSGLISLGGTDQMSNTEDSATATIVETIDTPVALGHALDGLPPELQTVLRGTIEFPSEAKGNEALQRAMLIRHMSRNLDVTHSGRSYVVEITYNSESPQLSAAVANAVADGYLRSRSDLRLNVYRQMLANLDKEIDELTSNLAMAEQRAQTTRERGRLMSMRFETLTGQKQDEAIEASAGVYAQQREAEREVEATAAVYERLLLEHRQIQSRIGAPELTVQLFAPAVVPLSPAGFNAKPMILALGLMAGFLAGASLAILRNAWQRRTRRV